MSDIEEVTGGILEQSGEINIMMTDKLGKRQSSAKPRSGSGGGSWINNEAIELMMNEEDTAFRALDLDINNGVSRDERKTTAQNGGARKNNIDDDWMQKVKGHTAHEHEDPSAKGVRVSGLKFVNSIVSSNYFPDADLGVSDDEGDVGETSIPNVTADDVDEGKLLKAVADAHLDVYQPKKKPEGASKVYYQAQNSMETSASESSSHRRGRTRVATNARDPPSQSPRRRPLWIN